MTDHCDALASHLDPSHTISRQTPWHSPSRRHIPSNLGDLLHFSSTLVYPPYPRFRTFGGSCVRRPPCLATCKHCIQYRRVLWIVWSENQRFDREVRLLRESGMLARARHPAPNVPISLNCHRFQGNFRLFHTLDRCQTRLSSSCLVVFEAADVDDR